MSFDSLGLSPEILRAVRDKGYITPTPVQEQAIPVVLDRRDLLAGAQTGTGKTAAFVLPILERLKALGNTSFSPARHPIRALILTPTRELAIQVEASVRAYGRHLPLRSTTIYGGVPMPPQIRALASGVEIVVATPGRLLDHVRSRTVDLRQVEILVLDEGDRMLDMGFIADIRSILALLPPRRQNLLFSATFSTEIRRLADTLLDRPASVDVAPRNTAAEGVDQFVYLVDKRRKRELLSHLVRSERLEQVLVFTRTKHGASRLSDQLARDGINAVAIHGDKTQPQRVKALEDFKRGEVAVLVATDVAARGLDIEELPLVVNFDLPDQPHDYLHRIGRTARAGLTGRAISIACLEEEDVLRAINRLQRRDLPVRIVPGFEPAEDLEAVHHTDPRRSGVHRAGRSRPSAGRGSRGVRSGSGAGGAPGIRSRTQPSSAPRRPTPAR